jgi:hypothetical protein
VWPALLPQVVIPPTFNPGEHVVVVGVFGAVPEGAEAQRSGLHRAGNRSRHAEAGRLATSPPSRRQRPRSGGQSPSASYEFADCTLRQGFRQCWQGRRGALPSTFSLLVSISPACRRPRTSMSRMTQPHDGSGTAHATAAAPRNFSFRSMLKQREAPGGSRHCLHSGHIV